MRGTDTTQHLAYLHVAGLRLGVKFDPAKTTWLSSVDVVEDEAFGIRVSGLNGVVVFANYTDFDVEMFVASWSPRWAARGFIRACFRYAFNQLAVDRVSVRVLASNWAARNMVLRLGFKQEGVIRRGHAGENVFLYGMLKSECRWIAHEQKEQPEGAGSAGPEQDHRRGSGVQPIQH